MEIFRDKYRTNTMRLKSWDYTTPWWYFVTICTKNHKEFFGDIENNKMILNEYGKVAEECWRQIITHCKKVELDYFIIMPNHVHGIIIINESNLSRDVACYVSTRKNNNFYSAISPQPNSLSSIIRSYKSAVTKQFTKIGFKHFQWQPRFYDRIIRDENELFNIRKYIMQNPLKWDLEKAYPENYDGI